MKIGKYLALVMIVVAAISCNGKKDNSTVVLKGKFSDMEAFEKVTLKKLDRAKTLISEAIVNDGEFEISFEPQSADFYQLDFPNNDFLYLIIQPGEAVKLDISGFPIRENVKISGSDFTTHFLNVGNSLRPFEIRLDSLNKAYSALASDQERQEQRDMFAKIGEEIEEGQRSVIREFAKNNSSSLANLFYLNKLDINKELDLFEEVNANLMANFPENVYVQELNYTVTAEATMKPGKPAPDFELESPDGELIKVSDYRGKYLLLDFWASWCGPCRRENPKVVALYNEFKDKGFEILGVSLDDDRDKWLGAIEDDGLIWDHVSDLKKWQSAPAKLYAVRAIPHTVLVDPEGNIVAVKLRGGELRYKLEELLNQ
ncbi:MAG: hypothetical protein C0593_06875 [Marinilabiliales bacterium]|nr:MAG: hypothetical protein C0593_06875 [Marinilabiliales bacterium]